MKLPSTKAAEDFVDGKGAHRVFLTTAGRVFLGYAFMSRPKTNA